jgi:hypothetical protein
MPLLESAADLAVGRVRLEPPYHCGIHEAPSQPTKICHGCKGRLWRLEVENGPQLGPVGLYLRLKNSPGGKAFPSPQVGRPAQLKAPARTTSGRAACSF